MNSRLTCLTLNFVLLDCRMYVPVSRRALTRDDFFIADCSSWGIQLTLLWVLTIPSTLLWTTRNLTLLEDLCHIPVLHLVGWETSYEFWSSVVCGPLSWVGRHPPVYRWHQTCCACRPGALLRAAVARQLVHCLSCSICWKMRASSPDRVLASTYVDMILVDATGFSLPSPWSLTFIRA